VFGVVQTIALGSQLPTITGELTITGPGQDLLTIDAGDGTNNLPGDGDGVRIFDIDDGTGAEIDVELIGLTLTGGDIVGSLGDGGGAIRSLENLTLTGSTVSGNSTTGTLAYGGGIFAGGDLALTDSTISGNTTAGLSAYGGGIFAEGDVTLTQSTVSENSTTGDVSIGGGIFARGAVTLTQSTVSGNSTSRSSAGAGGIFASGAVTLTQSTVSGNSTTGSDAHGGGISSVGAVTLTHSTVSGNSTSGSPADGGGIFAFGAVALTHSIVAGNTAGVSGPDLRPGTGTPTVNYSLIGDNAGTSLVEAQTADAGGNLIGSAAGSGIIDPLLAPLADNGGPTETHAPQVGSPAIDMGDTGFTSPPDYDQRGFAFDRVVGGRIDIGAVESGAVSADFDLDGVVSGFDFLLWQIGFGATGTAVHGDGDANIDSDVDGTDLSVWELQFGTAAPLAAATSALIATEPASQPSLTSGELADVALAVALGEEADGLSGEREFELHSRALEFFSAEPIGRSDMQPASSFSSPANTSATSTQETESPDWLILWEDAVDEVFASVFK